MSDFSSNLLKWYDENARDLPWRSHQSPYRTWISEIMLQQTQVETVIPYFERFTLRFPDLPDLAQASQEDVLHAWEGLGYYSRARNLHKAALIICRDYDCQLPCQPQTLQKLPGIGRYTAGAIASIAFDQPSAALDTNIRRVYARLINLQEPIRMSESEKKLWDFANSHLPDRRTGDFNQALMELGTLICKPQQPQCPKCPIRSFCIANANQTQEKIPVKLPKTPIPHFTVTAAVISMENKYLITQRPQEGLLGGLWKFPGGKQESTDSSLPACLEREIPEELGLHVRVGDELGVFKHAYSHFRITLHAFCCSISTGEYLRSQSINNVNWVFPAEMTGFPMGKVDRMIATHINNET